MKILVISDSHSRLDYLIDIWEKEVPDIVISAGDYSNDALELSYIKTESIYYIVRGNCDFSDYDTKDTLEFEILGKKILLTHGHIYGVKSSYEYLKKEANSKKVDICIFGHTHLPYLDEDKVILFNPGAVRDRIYGIIKIENKNIYIEHKKLIQ